MRRTFIVLLLMCLTGCHESGTWQDDPGNFERVFNIEKPVDVTVVNSWYWRSPHWTYEFAYFLHIRGNVDFQDRLIQRNKLKRMPAGGEKNDITNFADEKPAWFIPGTLDQYEIWTYVDRPSNSFRVFIDRRTGDIFLSDHQL